MKKVILKIFIVVGILLSFHLPAQAVNFVDDKDAFKDLKPVEYRGRNVRKYIKQWVDNEGSYHKAVYYAYGDVGEEEIRHGRMMDFYENGQVRFLAEYVDGQKDGKFTRWFENGTKAFEAHYRNGEIFGISGVWDLSGVKIKEVIYIDKQQYKERHWDKSKNLIAEGLYKNGQPWEGAFVVFDESLGNLIQKYKNGKLIKE